MSDWQSGSSYSVAGMGEWVDGWADLLSGLGDKRDAFINAFKENSQRRNMPAVDLRSGNATVGMIGASRPFYFARTRSTGATVAAYIGNYGADLYLSWDLYVRRIFNWRTVIILAVVALALVSIPTLRVLSYDPGFWIWNLPGFALNAVTSFIFLCVLTAGAGLVMRGRLFAFFFKQLTVFDVDDIKALSLAVHKAMQETADAVGIDSHRLRVKDQFRAGSRDRLI